MAGLCLPERPDLKTPPPFYRLGIKDLLIARCVASDAGLGIVGANRMNQDCRELIPKESQHAAAPPTQNAARTALLPLATIVLRAVLATTLATVLATALAACSGLASSNEAAPEPLQADYQELIANYLKSAFKNRAAYDSYEISDPRWTHSNQGWSWLTCVRFQDRGRTRSYTLFLQSGKIVDGRYAVETDGCDAQAYSPFAPMNGVGLEPLH
jgi:hypothetical protein